MINDETRLFDTSSHITSKVVYLFRFPNGSSEEVQKKREKDRRLTKGPNSQAGQRHRLDHDVLAFDTKYSPLARSHQVGDDKGSTKSETLALGNPSCPPPLEHATLRLCDKLVRQSLKAPIDRGKTTRVYGLSLTCVGRPLTVGTCRTSKAWPGPIRRAARETQDFFNAVKHPFLCLEKLATSGRLASPDHQLGVEDAAAQVPPCAASSCTVLGSPTFEGPPPGTVAGSHELFNPWRPSCSSPGRPRCLARTRPWPRGSRGPFAPSVRASPGPASPGVGGC